jgi:hypothetical protein
MHGTRYKYNLSTGKKGKIVPCPGIQMGQYQKKKEVTDAKKVKYFQNERDQCCARKGADMNKPILRLAVEARSKVPRKTLIRQFRRAGQGGEEIFQEAVYRDLTQQEAFYIVVLTDNKTDSGNQKYFQ